MQNDYSWQDQDWAPETRARNNFWITIFLFLSLLACASAAVLVPGGLGLLAGYNELQAQNHESAIQHFQRGLGYLAENYPELAYTEFEIAVKYDAGYEPAHQKLREIQGTIAQGGNPAQQEENRVAAALFDEATELSGKKQWDDAINRLEQLRALNTGFRAQEANDLLFQAYSASGKAAVASRQIEVARERFDAALTIHSGDPDLGRQRDLATLYLDGQQAAGYKWEIAIAKFGDLYKQDPNYADVKQRLVDAYVQYGDVAMKQNAACLAQREYDFALALVTDRSISDKRSQAVSLCRQAIVATPTPLPLPGSEIYTARIQKDSKACTTGTGDVVGIVRDVLGQPLAGITVAYYADGIDRATTKTNAAGQYQFIWGSNPGQFHIIVLGSDARTQAGAPADVDYPGGNKPGCHVIVDWQRTQ